MFEILLGLVIIAALGFLAYVRATASCDCNQNCNQGRNCTCKVKQK